MEVYTIGFTKKTATQFFESLKKAKVKKLIDVRLNNTSQLAAFAKRDDLEYFLRVICDAEYVHEPLLAPTQDILDEFKKNKGVWQVYEKKFRTLLKKRKVEDKLDKRMFDVRCVLLCSEPTPEHCHRRIVTDYLQSHWGKIDVTHI